MVGASASMNPSGNFYPGLVSDVGFVDFANGNYRLTSSSPYSKAGSDGKDVGVDFDQLNAALGGSQPSPTPTRVPVASISFVQVASATKGTWKNMYGGDWYRRRSRTPTPTPT